MDHRVNDLLSKGKALKDDQKVKIIRAMPWRVKKSMYRQIAKKEKDEAILNIVESFATAIKQTPDIAKRYHYQRDLDYLIKMLERYNRL